MFYNRICNTLQHFTQLFQTSQNLSKLHKHLQHFTQLYKTANNFTTLGNTFYTTLQHQKNIQNKLTNKSCTTLDIFLQPFFYKISTKNILALSQTLTTQTQLYKSLQHFVFYTKCPPFFTKLYSTIQKTLPISKIYTNSFAYNAQYGLPSGAVLALFGVDGVSDIAAGGNHSIILASNVKPSSYS